MVQGQTESEMVIVKEQDLESEARQESEVIPGARGQKGGRNQR